MFLMYEITCMLTLQLFVALKTNNNVGKRLQVLSASMDSKTQSTGLDVLVNDSDFSVQNRKTTNNHDKMAAYYSKLVSWLLSPSSTSGQDEAYIGPVAIQPSKSGQGYGVYTTQSVQKNELLLRIPYHKCISVDSIQSQYEYNNNFSGKYYYDATLSSSLQTLIRKAGPGGEMVALAGYLSHEWLCINAEIQNDNDSTMGYESSSRTYYSSPHEPYLRTLSWERSENQEHVLFWSKDELNILKGSLAEQDALDLHQEVDYAITILKPMLRKSLQQFRANMKNNTMNNDDKSFPSREASKPSFRFPWMIQKANEDIDTLYDDDIEKAIRGAFVILLSRSFEDDNLVPLLDMLQHDSNPNIHHKMVSKNKDSSLDDSDDYAKSVEVRARFDLESGVELLNCYQTPDMKDYQFFTRFGFIPEFNGNINDIMRERDDRFFI